MIKFSNEEGFIKARGIAFRDGQDKNIVLPEVGIGVFSRHLFNDIVQKFESMEVGYLKCANFERNVYIIRYNNTLLTFFMAGVGGPLLAGDIEELHAQGVKKFIIFGNCGVLDKNIEDCSIIIPTKGYREEGVSYHYVDASETIDMNPKYVDDFIDILNEYNFSYTKGYTWTTDAFYRETREKINYFKEKNVLCVEMEGTTIAAVCKYLDVDYFTFYYAGDNLDSTIWDKRSLDGLEKIDKKKEVALLAFELGVKISEK